MLTVVCNDQDVKGASYTFLSLPCLIGFLCVVRDEAAPFVIRSCKRVNGVWMLAIS